MRHRKLRQKAATLISLHVLYNIVLTLRTGVWKYVVLLKSQLVSVCGPTNHALQAALFRKVEQSCLAFSQILSGTSRSRTREHEHEFWYNKQSIGKSD